MLQTRQRIGTSAGIAAVGAVFFAAVTGTRGDWAEAFQRGLLVVLTFVLAALCGAVADLVMGRRETHPRHARQARDRHPATGG